MLPPRISLRCMMLAAVLALQLLCAAQDHQGGKVGEGQVGDWGTGEIAAYKKTAINAELQARAGVKAKTKSGQSDRRTDALVARLGLNEKLDFEMVGKTISQLKEDISGLKERNALRRAMRDKMRAAAKITEAKLAKETGLDKTTLDNAMATAINDVSAANSGNHMSEQQMEGALMKSALTELNEKSGVFTGGWVHYILMMLVLVIVAGGGYVLYAKPEYAMSLLGSMGLGGALTHSPFDSLTSRVVFSKLRAKYMASQA